MCDKAEIETRGSDLDHPRIVTSSTCGRIMEVLGVHPGIVQIASCFSI